MMGSTSVSYLYLIAPGKGGNVGMLYLVYSRAT